jgi:hypothetical protein
LSARHGVFVITTVSAALLMSGCASTQLNYNTLDVASTIESVYTRQALDNLSKIIDDPYAMPSQVDLLQGTVQTSYSVSPTLSVPFSDAITHTNTLMGGAFTRTYTTAAGSASTGVGASVGPWTTNWNVVPLTDANTLRNLRALYRYVIYPGMSLQAEYTVARLEQDGKFVKDPYALLPPQCVLCSSKLIVNKRLRSAWLYWTNVSVIGPENPPPANTPLVNLGVYGNHRLFMTQSDYVKGYLSDFVLFLLPVAPLLGGAAPPKAGTPTPQGRAPLSNRTPFGIPQPSYNVPGKIQD